MRFCNLSFLLLYHNVVTRDETKEQKCRQKENDNNFLFACTC